MKKILFAKIMVSALLFTSCSTLQQYPVFNDSTITTAVSVGTATGLRFVNATKRTAIANYLYTYSGALRTITGNPTPEQLTQQINAFIPADVKTNYPEIVAFAVPLIVTNYEWAYSKWGNNGQKLYQVLNDIATGIETGASAFTH